MTDEMPDDMQTDSRGYGWTTGDRLVLLRNGSPIKSEFVGTDDHCREVFELRRQIWDAECSAAEGAMTAHFSRLIAAGLSFRDALNKSIPKAWL